MADPVKETAGKAGTFLIRKVGPLPMWAWMGIGAGIYFYYSRKQSKAAAGSAAANQQTDPAGNIGTIDPATGYVYGTPEDTAALAANNAGTSSPSGSAGQGGTSGGQSYADNNSWGIAAVNLLVGLGIDATTANQAVQLYLSSQPLTTSQQADVNLAIKALGPPPTLPGPVTGNPPPVTTPPGTGTVTVPNVKGKTVAEADAAITAAGLVPGTHSTDTGTVNGQTPGAGAKVAKGSTVDLSVTTSGGGGGKSAPPPGGLTVQSKTSTSLAVKWNRSSGATGYYVVVTDAATKRHVNAHAVSSGTLSDNTGNLTPGHTYQVSVWAEPPATHNGAHASVTATLPKSAGKGGEPEE